MLLILCVDGLCFDLAEKRGYPRLPYQKKLAIPPELYYKGVPHTLKIWPSMFHGETIDFDLAETIKKIYSRDNWNYRIRHTLIKLGVKKALRSLNINHSKILKPVKKHYHTQPFIHEIDTVFDHYPSTTWNLPGLNPECIVGFPTPESLLPYIKRQYQNWKNITLGMALRPQSLNAAYTNILDGLSHRNQPTDPFYLDLQNHIDLLRKMTDKDIILVSDHGSTPEGDHTDHAYLGCTKPLTAKTVIDIRSDIENVLGYMTSQEEIYWETRYRRGGNSGKGSTGKNRAWKWKVIKKYAHSFLSIIDVGCGDLVFWRSKVPTNYIGIDISKTIIEKNRQSNPAARFINSPAEKLIPHIKAPIVLCLDLLFHIMDNDAYIQILLNLCEYSTDLIFVYTWTKNPLRDKTTDGKYQTHRNFENDLHVFEEKGFNLIEKIENPFDIGAMHVFKKFVL